VFQKETKNVKYFEIYESILFIILY